MRHNKRKRKKRAVIVSPQPLTNGTTVLNKELNLKTLLMITVAALIVSIVR